MIAINFNTETGVATLSRATRVKRGGDVPVKVTFTTAPDLDALALALATDADAPAVLAYLDTFTEESELVWIGTLDGSDPRLATHLDGKQSVAVLMEITATIAGQVLPAPNIPVTVEQRLVDGPTTSESGPFYALRSVAGKYRIKTDGSFQLWNATQSKFHTLTLSGASGAEILSIGAGES